jgi:hypothetical protein
MGVDFFLPFKVAEEYLLLLGFSAGIALGNGWKVLLSILLRYRERSQRLGYQQNAKKTS